MEKKLQRIINETYYFKIGKKIIGVHDRISGNVSRISGDVSGIRGNVSGIRGDISACNITEEERKKGINILDLLEEK